MTTKEIKAMAGGYFARAMQMIEDHEEGRTEFVRDEDVFQLLYDMACDFYECTKELNERVYK